MTFLGIGPGELLLIAILLLVVVGPERLPGMARTFGRTLVSVRNWMQTSPDAALVLRARQELEQELAEIRSSLLEVQSVRDEVLGVAKQLDETVSPIASMRPPSLSELIKEPADKPQPRASNGQSPAALPADAAPGTDLDGAQPAAALDVAEPSIAPDAAAEGLVLPPGVESSLGAPDAAAEGLVLPPGVESSLGAPEPAASEAIGARIEALAAELRAFQEYARGEAALRSTQLEALMADLHALQKQLKQRGLLAEDWQPPSWDMHVPNSSRNTHIEEADR